MEWLTLIAGSYTKFAYVQYDLPDSRPVRFVATCPRKHSALPDRPPSKCTFLFPLRTTMGNYFGIIAIVVSVAFHSVEAAQPCFYPDKENASADSPCSEDGSPSACCGANAICLRNGLCLINGALSRGNCTDSNWTAPECFRHCQDSKPLPSSSITVSVLPPNKT